MTTQQAEGTGDGLTTQQLKDIEAWYRQKAREAINAHSEDHFKQRANRVNQLLQQRLAAQES